MLSLVILAVAFLFSMNAARAAEESTVFNHAAFCSFVQGWAEKVNADRGVLLDAVTRNDGMAVLCSSHVVEFKKFLSIDPGQMRSGWQGRKQSQWNEIYCNDEVWRRAIDAGWIVAHSQIFVYGTRHWMQAQCGSG